jgi:hypothetical protein
MRFTYLAALLVAVAAPAPQSFTIKVRLDADPGKAVTVKTREKATGSFKILDANGKTVQDVKVAEEREEVFSKVILERGDKRPKKYKKVYEKAVTIMDGKATPTDYQGRTVLFELKEGKYHAKAEGAPELDKHTLSQLGRRESGLGPAAHEVLLPAKAVSVGDTWPISGKSLAATFAEAGDMTLDPDASKGDGRLVKAYRKDGKQYGIIEATMKLALKGSDNVTFDPPGTMEVTIALDVAIDGATAAGVVTVTGKLGGRGVLKDAGQTIPAEFNLDLTSRNEQSAQK